MKSRFDDNIFCRLSRYRPRPDRDSAEDFLTEAYAAVLLSDRVAASKALEELFGTRISSQFSVTTQSRYADGRPDMEFVDEPNRLIVLQENKLGADFEDTQLERYSRIVAYESKSHYRGLLVSCTPSGLAPNVPKGLVVRPISWPRVYRSLKTHLSSLPDSQRLWRDFLGFLESKRMVPFCGLSRDDEDTIASMAALRQQLEQLIDAVSGRLIHRYGFVRERSTASTRWIYRTLEYKTPWIRVYPSISLEGEHFFGVQVDGMTNDSAWKKSVCDAPLGFALNYDGNCFAFADLPDTFYDLGERQVEWLAEWISDKLDGMKRHCLIDLVPVRS